MDIEFRVELAEFNKGLAPLAHIDSSTYIGDAGQASDMKADIISRPGFLTQSPGLSDLTNGTQAGAVDELIRFIMEQPISDTNTYGLGATKLFKINSTTVVDDGTYPMTVTSMAEGESIVHLNGTLFCFYNTGSSTGDIATLTLSSDTLDNDWGSTTDQALEDAPHPSAVKEDIILFGNGRYVGSYIEGLATLNVQKLDFGAGAEVADIVFHSNYWWIAVNYGQRKSQVFMYDGSALSNILSDESGVGAQKIGFLYVHNGVVYVSFTDSTSGGFSIGYLSGRSINPLRYFSGSLPTHRQKTLYKHTIAFISSTDIWSFGASVQQLPAQISKLADAGHATVGGLASPFGTPLVASYDGATSYRLAKLSGYSADSEWKSIFVDLTRDNKIGNVHTVIVYTKPLGANATASLKIEGNQGEETATIGDITTENKTRHEFNTINMPAVEDVRVHIDYSGGDTSDDCPIRKIVLLGNFVER